MRYPTITMRELDDYIDQGYPMKIIDLRNNASFRQCHIKGAINIPYQELEDQINRFSPDVNLVFYCSRGGQSLLACNHLSASGYRVVNVANGISFYRGKYLARD